MTPNTFPRPKAQGFLHFFEKYKDTSTLFAKLALYKMFPQHVADPNFGKAAQSKKNLVGSPHFLSAANSTVTPTDKGYDVEINIFAGAADTFYKAASILAYNGITKSKCRTPTAEAPDALPSSTTIKGIQDSSDLVGEAQGSFVYKSAKDQDLKQLCHAIPHTGAEVEKTSELPFSVPSFIKFVKYNPSSVAITFEITHTEASYIMQLPKESIRHMDVWEFLRCYFSTMWGLRTQLPSRYFSLSYMREMNKGQNTRELLGYLVSNEAQVMYLPKAIDEVFVYEDFCYQHNAAADKGAYSAASRAKYANRIIYTDFAKEKLVYTNSSGYPATVDLTQYQVASTEQQYRMLQNPAVFHSVLVRFEQWGKRLGIPYSFPFRLERVQVNEHPCIIQSASISADTPLTGLALLLCRQTQDSITFEDVLNGKDEPIFRHLLKFISELKQRWNSSLLKGYSVPQSLQALAYLNLINEVPEQPQPNVYEIGKVSALPLVAKNLSRLPHQVKCASVLEPRPLLATLPVQAGGGKSPMCIFDIVHNMDKQDEPGKYAIMCPSHLVSQYLSENNYFTQGRLNMIPFNTETIKSYGLETLIDIIAQAPVNTVVVVDMDALKYITDEFVYGSASVTMYEAAQRLKHLGFKYILIDESHYLANSKSQRTVSCSVFVNGVTTYRRIASGTLNFDSPSDLPPQYSLLDPTTLFSREAFNNTYGKRTSGTRVLEWKPDASKQINKRVARYVAQAAAQRKEWAALLPHSNESIFRTRLTANQQKVYEVILNSAIDEIKKNPAVMKRMQEDEDADLDGLLNPYLARLEQFITAPGRDELGKLELEGYDLVSPKVLEIVKRVKYHIDNKIPGKVLIFTNYVASAEEIYANLPEDLRKMCILYTAQNKHKLVNQFNKDDTKQIMVGVEVSLNTGLNLQKASRLIRVETVWSPGLLEQGEARVKRPQLKTREDRAEIFFDWIVADLTIDITKLSRLISKIVTVERFENSHLADYEALPEVPVIKMTIDNILSLNDWDTSLAEYADVYRQLRQVQKKEYEAYKQAFIAKYGTNFLQPVQRKKFEGNAFVYKTNVFTKGVTLPFQDELGLHRVDTLQERDLVGKVRILTSNGVGKLLRVNKDTIRVEYKDGSKASVHKQSSFAILGGSSKLHKAVAEKLKMRTLKYTPSQVKVRRSKSKLEFGTMATNQYFGVTATINHTHDNLVALQKDGFQLANCLYRIKLKGRKHLQKLVQDIDEHGLTYSTGTKADTDTFLKILMAKDELTLRERCKQHAAKNPYTMPMTSNVDNKTIHLYIDVKKDSVYLVTDNPSAKALGFEFLPRKFVKFGRKKELKQYLN